MATVLNKTTETAIRALVFLGLQAAGTPISPRRISACLGESASYLCKVTAQLTRAGIVRSHRGAAGGITLDRAPEQITIRAILEACQGQILANYCRDVPVNTDVCAYHLAMRDLHQAIGAVLERWTLADLLRKPRPSGPMAGDIPCKVVVDLEDQ